MKSKKIYAMFQEKDVLRLWDKLYDDNGETKIRSEERRVGKECM